MIQLVPLQAFGVAFVLVFFLIVLAVFAFWVAATYWVYTDASERGRDDAGLWAIATFAGGVFGLIAYLIVREE